MARTIAEIQQDILNKVAADATLSAKLTSTSKTAIWRLWALVVATCQWTLETLFDLHKTEVTGIIDNMKPHSLRWYANMAKAFQYGYNLAEDEDHYDNSGLTDDQVAASKIVAYSAVVEQEKGLRVKVAKSVGDNLESLGGSEKAAFEAYMNEVKDAGVRLQIDSDDADHLILELDIYYDPQILDGNGSRISDGATPVKDAVYNYLKNLPFNGWFVLAYFIDALQKVEGVVIPQLVRADAYYGDHVGGAINVKYQPDAGYLKIYDEDTDLILNYKVQQPLI